MIARVRFVVLAVILVFTAGTIRALDDPVVAVTEEWPPLRISAPVTACGFAGGDTDIVTLMTNQSGLEAKVRCLPFARRLGTLRAGDADIITGVACALDPACFEPFDSDSRLELETIRERYCW